MQPLVSVILPVYNGEQFLANAIQAIKEQDYQPLEILVINDGSTDGTAAIMDQFQDEIRSFHQAHQGPAAARNYGLRMAEGEIYAFFDVDDLWSEGLFPQMIDQLLKDTTSDIIQGLMQQILIPESMSNQSHITHPQPKQHIPEKPYRFIHLTSALYRKSVFQKVGIFDESLMTGEDFDWFLRAWEHRIKKIDIDEIFLIYRKHKTNMTHNRNLVKSGILQLYKKRLDRIKGSSITSEEVPQDFPPLAQYINGIASDLNCL
jgi:glycosyltransferase involved in cell wall biosynthesis